MAKCKRCEQDIEFQESYESKKFYPVDPDYVRQEDLTVGLRLITDGGNIVCAGPPYYPSIKGRVVHFDTCGSKADRDNEDEVDML